MRRNAFARAPVDTLRARVEARLNGKGAASLPARAAARLWQHLAQPVRRVALPGVPVIGLSGPTLGGSGVTATAKAIALRLARSGASVSVVCHGYRGRSRAPHWVKSTDPVDFVGDEALELCRALGPVGIRLVVGQPRTDALALAGTRSDVIVVDGLLQTSPTPLSLSLLALEAEAPWGTEACPPVGNLRASPRALIRAADAVVWHEPPGADVRAGSAPEQFAPVPCFRATSTLRVLDALGNPVPLTALRGATLGLLTGVARPERVEAALARLGIRPVATIRLADHASAGTFHAHERAARPVSVDAWLVTAKCATKVAWRFAGAAVLVIHREIALPETLERRLDGLLLGGACLSAPPRAMVPSCSRTE